MFNNGDPVSDHDAEEIWNDAHPACLECGEPGCLQDECPTPDSCDLPHAVIHCKEPMHETCVAAFDRHVENREVA